VRRLEQAPDQVVGERLGPEPADIASLLDRTPDRGALVGGEAPGAGISTSLARA
jgi:hypothetical protein